MSESDSKSANTNQDIPDNAQDLTIFVQNLLEQMVTTNLFLFEFSTDDLSSIIFSNNVSIKCLPLLSVELMKWETELMTWRSQLLI
jgi:hypothetical protein